MNSLTYEPTLLVMDLPLHFSLPAELTEPAEAMLINQGGDSAVSGAQGILGDILSSAYLPSIFQMHH